MRRGQRAWTRALEPEPRFPELHFQGGSGSRQPPCWPWRWLHARVVGVRAGLTLTSHMLSQENSRPCTAMSPAGTLSSEDIAAAVCFALENRSMTGHSRMLVDGGQHLQQRFERDLTMM